jgi:hypothetical protein
MTALSKTEIHHRQALRAKNIAARNPPTMPTNPVDNSDVTPMRGPLDIMATRAFTSNLNVSDLRYMALALLQLQDELHEARERIKRLENSLPGKSETPAN